jgi:hypothetical protein
LEETRGNLCSVDHKRRRKKLRRGRHVGLDFYDLLIEEALEVVLPD